MQKKNLIVANVGEEAIAFACALITRYLSQCDASSVLPDYFLTLPGAFQEEVANLCSHSGGYATVFFLGELFPDATDKKAVGDALEAAVGKDGASSIIYISGSGNSPRKYVSGPARKDARYSETAMGLLNAVLEHCAENTDHFEAKDILDKQNDEYTLYCLRNALDEFRLHHDTQYFTTLVRQLAEQTDAMPKKLPTLPENLEKLSGKDWADLLVEYPDFSEQCSQYDGWKLLSGDDWGKLLSRDFARFQEHCDWKKLTDVDSRMFVRLLERHPEIIRNFKYDWERLDAGDWADLLGKQPQFSEECKCWNDFSGQNWMKLIKSELTRSNQSQFISQCTAYDGWAKMDRQAWLELLPMQTKQISFVQKCPSDIWTQFDASDWMCLLRYKELFFKECSKYDGWDKLNGDNWVELLTGEPKLFAEYARRFGWSKLNGGNWRSLLTAQPQFEKQCTKYRGWFMFSEEDWDELLKVHPDFQKNRALVKQFDCLDSFSCGQWAELLQRQPALFWHCPETVIQKLDKSSWIPLLAHYPELSEKCPFWNALTPEDWCTLLSRQATYAFKCNECRGWSRFQTEHWISLLCVQPQFADYFLRHSSWDALTTEHWIALVKEQPQFQRRRPEFARHMREFSVNQWCNLLSAQPQMAQQEIPWDKFTADNWIALLGSSSYFNEEFRNNGAMESFNLQNWNELLCAQPAFIPDCPFKDAISPATWRRIAMKKVSSDDELAMIPRKTLHSLDGKDRDIFLHNHPCSAHLLTEEQILNANEFAWAKSFVANGGKMPGNVMYDWKRLKAGDWSFLLSNLPEYKDTCTQCNGWKHFEGKTWSILLSERPEFSGYCDQNDGWASFDGSDWLNLLVYQPQFADKCEWSTLTSSQLMNLLLRQPSLKNNKTMPKPQFTLSEELLLAEIWRKEFKKPAWLSKGSIPWDNLTSTDLARMLVLEPSLEKEYCTRGLFGIFNSVEWYIILRDHPEFARHCPLEHLSPKMRLALLSLDGVANDENAKKAWPEAGEINCQEVIHGIVENKKIVQTFKDGKMTISLINWRNISAIKPEFAPCCPPSYWDELDIKGWHAMESRCLPSGRQGHPNALQEEKLWKFYSYFLRLPQKQLDEFAKSAPTVFENLYRNAMTKYRGMLVGDGLRPLRDQLRMAAGNHYPVLILGESGTGKENSARFLHTWSERTGQFEAFNCASSTSGLIESTLFGHTKGAFTGAVNKANGIILKANEGTLFFDEIAEFPLETQAKLLRVMQWRASSQKDAEGHMKNLKKMVYAYRPVGGEDEPEIEVDVRIIAATNRNLEKMIAETNPNEQRFRQDLYYRLNSIVIETIPLREHKEDIEEIANLFWRVDLQMPTALKKEDIDFLQSLDYPANVRQLQQLLVQYSIYYGHKTLQEIYGHLSRSNRGAEAAENNETTDVDDQPTDATAAPELPCDDVISIIDEQTGTYKTAEAIDKEYARLVHRKLGKGLAETAHALKVAVNTLRNRLK